VKKREREREIDRWMDSDLERKNTREEMGMKKIK
jgi:hypothetical protein